MSAAWLLCVTASGSVILTFPEVIPLQRCGDQGTRLQEAGTDTAAVIAAYTVTQADEQQVIISSTNRRMIVPIAELLQHIHFPSRYQLPGMRLAESIVTALVRR
jgi:hypothetical protein